MSTKLRPGQKIKLKSVEELLGVSNEESAMDIEIVKIRPFKNHPFKVVDDDKMQDLVESIRVNGILSPVLIRPIGNDIYEMVSGHRRMHAASILGMECVPAIIREMTDDEAVVKMVDANICEAENELFDILESGSDTAYQTALMFYDHLNDFIDSFLEEHDFSREEIRQGILEVAKMMGALYAATAILDEEAEE